ncbi:MAG TPA: porin [Gemmatimonadales bacterium]|nr:porin [Gemmatimonadales bacterium]
MRRAPRFALQLLVSVIAASLAAQTPVEGHAAAVRITGYMQPRFQAVGDSATFLLRRARFAVEGQAAPWATYRVQVELRTLGAPATPPASPLTLSATDIWVRVESRRWAATAGQFRVPFALESVTSSGILETTERSRIVLAARRDIGVQAQWSVADRVVLQAAVVNGDGPNRGGNRDNRMAYFARVIVTPVKGLDVGGALAGYSDSTGADAQAIYRTHRWTWRVEYIRVRQRVTDVWTTGWYALATYNIRPERLQLVSRVEQFDPSDQVATDRLTGYLLGGQYFIRGDDLKLMADYEVFREQAAQLQNDRLVVQLQVRW